MTIKSGYFRNHVHINLTDNKVEHKRLSDEFLEKYIGGRGFGAKLLWDALIKNNFSIDPLGPENLLVVAAGPLSGTYVPSSGKNSFITVSPATGLYGDSSIGGDFGVELRQAGIDVLSIEGKAETLSIVFIDNGELTVIPMPQLKGKTCLETEGAVKEKLGSHAMHIASIGVAGENMVRFACVNADWSRNAGRTGMGAVMGSKNLKAIAVRGHKDLPVHDIKGLMKESEKAIGWMKEHKYFRFWQQQGLMNVIDYANEEGILPTFNFKDTTFAQHSKINGETMLNQYKIGDSACFACPMCCGNICLVKNGKFRGTITEGPEYESAAMLGSNVGIDRFDAILAANKLCDELGVDTISTGNLVGAVIEGYEKNILTLADLDGQEITWGNESAVLELIRKIANREGIGTVLADGSKAVIEKWPEMDKIILQIKGLEQSAYDCRASLSMSLAYATSDIGAHHTRAWTIAKELEQGANWSDDERVDIVIYHQSLRPLFDMLGVCRLPWIELGLNEKHYENFYRYVTGHEASLDDMLKLSDNIYNMTRCISVHQGVTRKDDNLPYKTYACPPMSGPQAGKVIDKERFDSLLSRYYEKRGWDAEGRPSKEMEARFS